MEELEYEWVKDKVVTTTNWQKYKTTKTTKCKKTLLEEELNKGDKLKAALQVITDEYAQKRKDLEKDKKTWINKLKNDMLTAQSDFERYAYRSVKNKYNEEIEKLKKEYSEMENAAKKSATVTRSNLIQQRQRNRINIKETINQRMQYLEILPNKMALYPQDEQNIRGKYIPQILELQSKLDQNEKTYQV